MATEAFKGTVNALYKDYVEFHKEQKDKVTLSFKDYVELYTNYLTAYNSGLGLGEVEDEDEILEG